MTAGTIGYTPEFVKKNEEIMTNSLLYDLVNQMYLNTDRMKRRRIKFSRQNARLYAILRKSTTPQSKPSKRHPLKNFDYPQIGRKDNIHNHFPHQRFLFPFP